MAFPNYPLTVLSTLTGADQDPLSEGGNWVNMPNAGSAHAVRVSNTMAGDSSDYWMTQWTPDTFVGPFDVTLDVPTWDGTDQVWYILICCSTADFATFNGYAIFGTNAPNITIERKDAGASTSIGTIGTNPFASGDKIGIERTTAGVISVYRYTAGAWAGSPLVSSSASLTYTSGKVAFGAFGTVYRYDNPSVGVPGPTGSKFDYYKFPKFRMRRN